MKPITTVSGKTLKLSTLSVCVLMATPLLHAQSIEEVLVTAQKRTQSLNELGLTVSVLSATDLQDKKISSLEDIAQAVPGLSFTRSGTDTPVYTLRGVGFYESTLGAYPDVSVYMDESPLPFPVMTSHIAFDLQRIEVLKGPQGTLFGNNATGGALNFIAAKPTEQFEGNVTLDYGRFNERGVAGYVSGSVSDTLKARLAVKAVRSDEWQKGYTIDAKIGEIDTSAARLILDWTPTEQLTISASVNYWADKGDPQAPQFFRYRPNIAATADLVPIKDQPPAPRNNRAADFTESLNLRRDNELQHYTLRADYEFASAITLTSLTSYAKYDHFIAYDGDGVPERNFDVPEIIGKITSFSQELRLANSGDSQLRWVVGGNYSEDTAKDNYLLDFSVSTVTVAFPLEGFSGYRSDQEMENWAVFANVEYDINDFTLKAGARYTEADRDGRSCNYDVPGGGNAELFEFLSIVLQSIVFGEENVDFAGAVVPPGACHTLDTAGILGAAPTFLPGDTRAILEEDNTAWRFGVDWRATEDVLLYANVTKGFKAGSYPALASSTNAQLIPVTQESVLSYEAGIKASLLERRMQLNAAAFTYDYEDRQVRSKLTDPLFGKLDALVNVPKASVEGFEAEAIFQPTIGLSVYVNYIYLDATIDEFVGENDETLVGVPEDFSGTPLPYTPKTQVNIGGRYEWPIGNSLTASVGIDYSRRSGTTAIIGGSEAYDIDSYAILNMRAGVKSQDGKWSVMAWGKNLRDEYYWTNVTSYYDTVARYTGLPRTYGITFSYDF